MIFYTPEKIRNLVYYAKRKYNEKLAEIESEMRKDLNKEVKEIQELCQHINTEEWETRHGSCTTYLDCKDCGKNLKRW